jgi:hypothetical protein
MQVRRALLLLVSALSLDGAFGAAGVPNLFLDIPYMSITDLVLQDACWSLPAGPLGLPCNPAQLADLERQRLQLDLSLDEQARRVIDYYEKVRDEDTVAVADLLLGKTAPTVSRAYSNIWYRNENWALTYTPARIGFASRVVNQAYPEITAHIKSEWEISLRGGYVVAADRNLRVGLQARYLDQKFIRQQFTLLDAVADPNLIQIHDHHSIMLEPGLAYALPGSWRPEISFGMRTFEVYRSGVAEGNTYPSVEAGIAVSPHIDYGNLTTALHFTSRERNDSWRVLTLGALYWFDTLQFSGSVGMGGYGLGVAKQINSLLLGFAYRAENLGASETYKSLAYSLVAEIGLQF